jgi:signal transduction histidine kinase/DNA-binding response OmpR family regulator
MTHLAQQKRVLVVDDDLYLAETIAEVLRGEGYEAFVCNTGSQALMEVSEREFDIALIDIRLSDMGGIDVLAKLKEKAPQMDVVVVTGNASVHSAIEALNHGASRYILKPTPPHELLSIVRDLFDRRELLRRSSLYLRRLEAQMKLSQALATALLPEEVARAAVDATRVVADVQACVLLLLGEDKRLKPLAWSGISDEMAVVLASNEDVVRYISSQQAKEKTPGMAALKMKKSRQKMVCPVALFRLRGRTSDLGLLGVIIRCGSFESHEEDLLFAIANFVGVALERAIFYERLEKAYSALKKAQREMVRTEKMSAIGRLASGLAHEIGTPLNIISGRAEYLYEIAKEDQNMRQGLKVIVEQIDRISSLFRQLLDFSREHTTEMAPMDLRKVVMGTLSLMDSNLRKANVSVFVDMPEALPLVRGNFNQLQQVFINLLMNSVDAINAKFKKGEAKRHGGKIAISLSLNHGGDEVKVSVWDNGIGIKDEDIDKVFEPFFTTKGVGAGTGLGLSVVYGIISDHGGKIEVESKWGEETRVSFTLKVAK